MFRTEGIWFKDAHGRTRILRGANLGGSSKVPYHPDGATWRSDHFFEHRGVSFVGRPFPLVEADEHFSRLRAWGMTFLRFLTTWEAVEHAGPGQYDEAYLDYLYTVIKKAGDYGLACFIDPHQDVWSRWTGGDGAPGWTLEAIGIDLTRLHVTGAAISHATHGDPFPRMIWPTNYGKYGAATLFTLFFGGNDFAPATTIDGVPAQEYLQSHYINAMKQVALRLKDLPHVVGYDSLNEPGGGYLGVQDLAAEHPGLLATGASPTAYQGMLAASGYPQTVDIRQMGFSGIETVGQTTLNPDGAHLFREGFACVWQQNGVWTDDGGSPRLLRPDHFARQPNGAPISVANDYIKPFVKRFIAELRAVHPGALLFLEGIPNGEHPRWDADDPEQAVNAAHWYDAITLFMKQFNREFTLDLSTGQPVMGAEAVAAAFTRQIAAQKHTGDTARGGAGIPTLIGEFGMPFDLDDKAPYQTGDFTQHVQALDLYYDAMDANLLSCTIWNYTADNSNAHGDQWNDEDLSIFSRDQQTRPWRDDIHSGGRGLAGFVRPYALAVAGTPTQMRFELETRAFELVYQPDPAISAPTEIFVPEVQYPDGFVVESPSGRWRADRAAQRVFIEGADAPLVTVRIRPA